MTLTPQFLDELRARTTLSTLVGKTVKLTRAGREFKGCCPFHNEKTPSFYVNDEKGFYHCFGCSAHGDAIRWMTDQRGLPFLDAVNELAAAAGMEVPAADPRAAEKAEAAKTLHDANAEAARWYAEQLQGPAGATARDLLARRGIKPDTVRAFQIGFAPDDRAGIRKALRHFGDALLIEAGLLIQVDGKEPYDRFRGRLMIPIRDARGRVIAFGGRIIGEGEPKYLNSPETPLFDKGRTLFNLERASPASRKAGRVIVVEGYMDVIALAQAGIEEAVAPLGTALTEMQLERLWRMADVPIICLDGDSAGQKAAIRAANRALPMLAPGRSLAFATMPPGQDPDDVTRAGGKAALEPLLGKTAPLVDQLWRHEVAAGPLETPEQRAGLKRRLADLAGGIADAGVRSEYLAEFRRRADALFAPPPNPRLGNRPDGRDAGGIPMRAGPGGNRPRWQPPEPPPGGVARAVGSQGIDPALARAVIGGLINYPADIARHMEALGKLAQGDTRLERMADVMADAIIAQPTLDRRGMITILAAHGFAETVTTLLRADATSYSFNRKDADARTARDELAEAITVMIARPEVDAALAAATEAAKRFEDGAFERQAALVKERHDLDLRLANLVQANEDARAFSTEGN